MTLQNRVLPTGEIAATPERGTLMGNRGILHDDDRQLGKARWRHPHWVTCLLDFKGRRRALMQPRNYTELFFLDEPTALAAGHRPCGECRRPDFKRFVTLFHAANGTATLAEIDRLMHRDRVTRTRRQVRHTAALETLPDGAFILHDDAPHLVWGNRLLRYTPGGYTATLPRSTRLATVLTPASTVATLAAGYRPAPPPSATQQHP
ncbi:hypothetical protein XM53_02315 [Roseovarius atlanticus]|uniref:Ada DNA repair metal-binding domain-containing protein n=1 Tax=Roseovarius atlanticus TaxID=1641875 RepID=A0A0T5P0A8_9RHOB|nr:hypothetical protein [Roseovarius atlanticus]KRS14568.1 hypothetical protein XM53_02315 [Roseovarius atlanticus]